MKLNTPLKLALAALAAGWLGTLVPPKVERPPVGTTRLDRFVDLPSDLPKPVRRYLEQAVGMRVPVMDTVTFWGRARFRLPNPRFTVPLPVRYTSRQRPGQALERDMEITWFGFPILRGRDRYREGRGSMEIAGRLVQGERISQGSNMGLWAEGMYAPSVYVTDERARWEEVSSSAARLTFPFGEEEDCLTFRFDPRSGLPTRVEGLRYLGDSGPKRRWRVEMGRWRAFHGVLVPTRTPVIWEHQGAPWAIFEVEGVEYNATSEA